MTKESIILDTKGGQKKSCKLFLLKKNLFLVQLEVKYSV